MKILAIVGSPRLGGNTDTITQYVLEGAKSLGAEVETLYLSRLHYGGCIGCEQCKNNRPCVLPDDMQQVYEKMEQADGLVLASPTYFYNVTGITKLFLDRLYRYNWFHPEDRSVWTSPNEQNGLKYAVTVAVCEQETADFMGFTSQAMSMSLEAVGWRPVENLKILHLFAKGEAQKHPHLKIQGEKAGQKLVRTLQLAQGQDRV